MNKWIEKSKSRTLFLYIRWKIKNSSAKVIVPWCTRICISWWNRCLVVKLSMISCRLGEGRWGWDFESQQPKFYGHPPINRAWFFRASENHWFPLIGPAINPSFLISEGGRLTSHERFCLFFMWRVRGSWWWKKNAVFAEVFLMLKNSSGNGLPSLKRIYPLKMGLLPQKGTACLPTVHLQGENVGFREDKDYGKDVDTSC